MATISALFAGYDVLHFRKFLRFRPVATGAPVQRSTDSDQIRIDRRVPLHWLISTLAVVFMAAVSFYISLDRQADALQRNVLGLTELTSAVKQLTAQLNLKDVRDAQRDAQIAENQRNITELKAQMTAILRSAR